MYLRGESIEKDLDKAFELYQKSALQGNSKAQFNLASMYANGDGVAENRIKAKEWFSKSCENGEQDACEQYEILESQGY